jgi:hypothetical protein
MAAFQMMCFQQEILFSLSDKSPCAINTAQQLWQRTARHSIKGHIEMPFFVGNKEFC